MTETQFLKRLREKVKRTKAEARTTRHGDIRIGRHCPISFVAGSRPCHTLTPTGKPRLGLSEWSLDRIMVAADFRYELSPLRRKLLKAVGL